MTLSVNVELPDGNVVNFEADTEELLNQKIDTYLLEEFPEE